MLHTPAANWGGGRQHVCVAERSPRAGESAHTWHHVCNARCRHLALKGCDIAPPPWQVLGGGGAHRPLHRQVLPAASHRGGVYRLLPAGVAAAPAPAHAAAAGRAVLRVRRSGGRAGACWIRTQLPASGRLMAGCGVQLVPSWLVVFPCILTPSVACDGLPTAATTTIHPHTLPHPRTLPHHAQPTFPTPHPSRPLVSKWKPKIAAIYTGPYQEVLYLDTYSTFLTPHPAHPFRPFAQVEAQNRRRLHRPLPGGVVLGRRLAAAAGPHHPV